MCSPGSRPRGVVTKPESILPQESPALEADLVFHEQANGFRIDPVLLLQNSRGEGFRRVFIQNRDNGLADDGAGVHTFIHDVDRTAGEFHAIIQRLFLRVGSRKGRQQGGMNIQDATRKRANEVRAEDAHETCQAHHIHLKVLQNRNDFTVEGFAFFSWEGMKRVSRPIFLAVARPAASSLLLITTAIWAGIFPA